MLRAPARVVFELSVLILAPGCKQTPPPPRSVSAAPARGAEVTAPPRLLAWARARGDAGSDGASTFRLREDGEVIEQLPGIRVAASHGPDWRWAPSSVPFATEPCVFRAGDAGAVGDAGAGGDGGAGGDAGARGQGRLLRGAFDRDGATQVAIEPAVPSEPVAEIDQRAEVLASLGPLVFLRERTSTFACGAHGAEEARFLIWDLERGAARAELLPEMPDRAGVLARAAPLLAADAKAFGGPFGDERPRITELVPVLDPSAGVRFEAQVTRESCYACGDGAWSSYTRSVRVPAEPPPALASVARELPSGVRAFARARPGLELGGWSSSAVSAMYP
jgi:hypothetical protein